MGAPRRRWWPMVACHAWLSHRPHTVHHPHSKSSLRMLRTPHSARNRPSSPPLESPRKSILSFSKPRSRDSPPLDLDPEAFRSVFRSPPPLQLPSQGRATTPKHPPSFCRRPYHSDPPNLRVVAHPHLWSAVSHCSNPLLHPLAPQIQHPVREKPTKSTLVRHFWRHLAARALVQSRDPIDRRTLNHPDLPVRVLDR